MEARRVAVGRPELLSVVGSRNGPRYSIVINSSRDQLSDLVSIVPSWMSKTEKVMDFRIILQENIQNITEQSSVQPEENGVDYTVTFVVGSCVLAVFLLLGVVASAYLCVTLKKGTFLWVTDSNRQLNRDKEDLGCSNDKDSASVSLRDVKSMGHSQETTHV